MGKTTHAIDAKVFITTFLNSVDDMNYLERANEIECLCIKGTITTNHFLFYIDGNYYILNLNNALCISWSDNFGKNAWVNRPSFTISELKALFSKVLTEAKYLDK